MSSSSLGSRLALALSAVGLLCAAAASAVHAADPSGDLFAVLHAAASTAPDPRQAKVISGLIGTWDVEYLDINKAGVTTRRTGQFVASWVLDGRAMQDVWIVDRSGKRTTREVYTDLRWFDPKTGTWPAVFFDPERASIATFTGEAATADRIVLHSPDLGTADSRWSFVDIGPDSFDFRDEGSNDGGKTWRLRSEYHMRRRAGRSESPG